ncbi:DegV family protein [Sporosarcina sp. P21c]|uniref:DegV family protein n=1 Tax=Sporosarcina TaxID=1569 RepID=UPI000A157294|nr:MULTISPECIES: DegV family protein [Sporosarcina]ARJ39777.1 fatty acid-binding protein DegV [Sporosarcina ureae]PIC65772.1 DegV family protein [Sporosarcina sp. P16a]PIC82021.1 DegV family protein [Sporosarcina sp. P1]PIC88567.1 DegV family protein [Sporosarcina sp. P21c]PIC91377.1 DegV family protein [Sporosarcina sp. P25]
MKTAIVTDTTAYLPDDIKAELGIYTIPLLVTIDGKEFKEDVDITTEAFYELVRGKGPLPKTSQPAIGDFEALFSELAKDYDAVITIHLSSGISGTYMGAIQAAELVPELEVLAFDSEISAYPQGFYAIRAAQLANEGVHPHAIIEELKDMQKGIKAYFMVDDLSHLQRGGRLSGAQALVGGLLQVKPVLHFEDKVIVPFEKIRTARKAMKRISDLLSEDAKNQLLDAAVIHANRYDDAVEWKRLLEEKHPNVDFTISHFGPVIGTHLGEGAMGLGWVKRRGT